ncbi:hypothetical protein SARC_00341 [Sphaeroforma arctica JP610]|uniref:BHLH domain-containing protein n=1 Tax=Sphaeroforma arctica JP610 TaxID=667725 RepID=A0A0L0GES8_9EUKA|nr:hypothetical protein SARC_00341 [Sphaeroforma arctica JP610]KNC87517.1 hypothetical protein SARC_00341 [Sphaeroforma arctica JP610]|eukprot:XP_014161419.1 hypothetical protein SARC_00341 [Sphaeroforma arctica JP610]
MSEPPVIGKHRMNEKQRRIVEQRNYALLETVVREQLVKSPDEQQSKMSKASFIFKSAKLIKGLVREIEDLEGSVESVAEENAVLESLLDDAATILAIGKQYTV